jgi:hypothetical protein
MMHSRGQRRKILVSFQQPGGSNHRSTGGAIVNNKGDTKARIIRPTANAIEVT